MSRYKYDLAKSLLEYFERGSFKPNDNVFEAFKKFPVFTEPTFAWAFLERADWLGTTIKEVSDRDKLPTSIMDWAAYVKSRDGFALVAHCTTVGEALSHLQDLIYAMEHGETL